MPYFLFKVFSESLHIRFVWFATALSSSLDLGKGKAKGKPTPDTASAKGKGKGKAPAKGPAPPQGDKGASGKGKGKGKDDGPGVEHLKSKFTRSTDAPLKKLTYAPVYIAPDSKTVQTV